MQKREIDIRNDGQEAERFVGALRKVVSVPKKDVEAQLEKERRQRAKIRDKKRKA